MAQSYDEAVKELSAFARTQWGIASPGSPLAYEGIDFTPPQDGSTYARLKISHNVGTRASLGGANVLFRRGGTMYLQVFTPIGEKAAAARQIGDVLVEAMEDAGHVGNIWFRDARLREVGPDKVWFQINVLVDFQYDRTT